MCDPDPARKGRVLSEESEDEPTQILLEAVQTYRYHRNQVAVVWRGVEQAPQQMDSMNRARHRKVSGLFFCLLAAQPLA